MRQLGELEAVVMDVLWRESEALTVREVMELLPVGRDRAYTTIMTVLDNLHRKRFLHRRRDGRAYRYRPVQSRAAHTATVMEELLAGSGDSHATLLHFIGHIGPDEADRLREALSRLDEGTS